jgi:TIR domain-containing protein
MLAIDRGKVGVVRGRGWDFFFSYKSENANEVRRIAERLMAAGYRVWLAEYEVLLRGYDEFRPRIRKGIRNCSRAVLFTTDAYSRSQHCRDEVSWLQERFDGAPSRIIEVCLNARNDAREVLALSSESPRLVAHLSSQIPDDHGEDSYLLAHLKNLTGLDLTRAGRPLEPGPGSDRFRARCAPVSFDASGFALREWKTHPADGTDVVFFRGEQWPGRPSFNVYFHYMPQSAPGRPLTMGTDPLDERERYSELRSIASWFMKATRRRGVFLKEQGLHLIWTDGGAQLALTHSFLRIRMRKYSVILSHRPPLQLIFTFGVTGSFEDFCRYVPLMDRVIETVRLEPA